MRSKKGRAIFFTITTISVSLIIWIFQAVNYLDIITDDGRDYLVYLNYTFLNLPKIISKILPFAFFFSFSYVITKYELNNELLIYWNFGINKIHIVNYFLIFSFFLLIIQILLTGFIVPKSQNLAKSMVRTSDYNFVDNFIKIKKFNAAINNLTIYTEGKDKLGVYNNIYIKKKNNNNNFQIIFSKKGIIKNKNNKPVLELYDGENTNVTNGKITNFSFTRSEFNLSDFSTNTILVKKTQEHETIELINCLNSLTNNNKNLETIVQKVRNCRLNNLDNIISELYKRLVVPLYLPTLMLIALLLITQSKEKINYSKHRIVIFILGLFVIIFSELTLRLVNTSFNNNLIICLIPIFSVMLLYSYYFLKFKINKS